ncbi:Carboxylic ester hydrolase {ECO:0000256/RuleBase:RU361235} {ECO:0000256/RuleBase:RU361235} [Serendipita indica DSM 11827]|nr:Carboxylic ester hydrolase {ECO:0000256/RuleBase:RU361235} {ECO:0000256/RuleBase:RU361235} [Serendipita indica DSM 11827]
MKLSRTRLMRISTSRTLNRPLDRSDSLPLAQFSPLKPNAMGRHLAILASNPVSTPIYTVESEDCLYLNVWTSPVANKLRPVFMWLYGGAWTSGTASGYFNDLTKWAKVRPDIVFVSINYRLNFYGYADSPALLATPMLVYAINEQPSVVVANIAAFGGDPVHIVLGGQSAGSASVAEYLYAYRINRFSAVRLQ